MTTLAVTGTVVSGHGVASGRTGPFPGGTIRAQLPSFAAAGLELEDCFPGTINLSVAPSRLVLVHPSRTLRDVAWWEGVPAETFSFAPCVVLGPVGRVAGHIYHPHPETKPDHPQPPTVVEILAPWIPGIEPGSRLTLEVEAERVALLPPPAP